MRDPRRSRWGLYVVLKTLHWTWACELVALYVVREVITFMRSNIRCLGAAIVAVDPLDTQ